MQKYESKKTLKKPESTVTDMLPGIFVFLFAFLIKTILKEGQVAYQIHQCALGNLYGECLSLKSMQVNPLYIYLHAIEIATWRSVFSSLAPCISLPTTRKSM